MALAEEKIRRLRHHHETDEENHRQDDTENPKDIVADKRSNSISIKETDRDKELKKSAQWSSDRSLKKYNDNYTIIII